MRGSEMRRAMVAAALGPFWVLRAIAQDPSRAVSDSRLLSFDELIALCSNARS
jgi:hypothetical protein